MRKAQTCVHLSGAVAIRPAGRKDCGMRAEDIHLADKASAIRHPPVQRYRYLLNCARILRDSLRSFRGHVHTQSANDPRGRCLSEREISQGLLTALPRPEVISPYLERLVDAYPWCDTVDLRFFLIGFALGQLHSSSKQDTEADRTA